MRSLLIMLIVLMSVMSFPSWGLTMNDLVKREGVFYEKFSDKPFTGEVIGQKRGLVKKGKQEGYWVSYYDNGQLWSKGNFKNGDMHGYNEVYYRNGQLLVVGEFKDGRGVRTKSYERDGSPISID